MGGDGDVQASLAELAARVLAGDRLAESILVARLTRPLRLVFRVRRVSSAEVDDLVQETLIIVLKRLRSSALNEADGVQAFSEATARNVWLAQCRKAGRREDLLRRQEDSLEPAMELPPEQRCSREEARRLVQESVADLSQSRDRELLREHYLNEVDKEALCARLGLSAAHFDRTLYNARERLRKLLRRRGMGGES